MSAIVANCAINLRCELTKPVKVEYIDGNMFSMDNAGNTAHVYIYYNGQPQEVVGSVSAEVIRPDGGTVAVTGAMSGNRAYVIFPQAVYAVPGAISCVIKVTEGTTTTTIAAFVANVYRSSTDQAIDPGQLIPSISSLISAIETAVGSIPADYSSLLATIAGTYSSSKTYNVGDYAWESGVLKRCIVPITAGETFTAAHWTNAVVCDDLSALKTAISGISDEMNVLDIDVDYKYSFSEELEENPASSYNKEKYGIRQELTQITLNASSPIQSGNINLKISNGLGRAGSNTDIDAWTTGITLIEGHKYRILMRYMSGTVTVPSGTNPPFAMIYKAGTHTAISGESNALDGLNHQRIFVATSDTINLVIRVSAKITLVNAVYQIILEDLTVKENSRRAITRIPNGYQQIEYIESSRTQAVRGYQKLNQDSRVVICFAQTGEIGEANNYIFGARYDSDTSAFYSTIRANGQVDYGYGGLNETSAIINNDGIHVFDCNKTNFYIDGKLVKTANAATFETPTKSGIAGIYANSNNYFGSVRVYYYAEYASGVLIAEYFPCVRLSDNAVGMYDVVNQVFCENAGTGSFTAGENVNIQTITKTLNEMNTNERDYVQQEADRVAEKVRNVQTGKSITFVACSDLHYNVDSVTVQNALVDMGEGIKKIAEQINVDFYACFGDIIYRLTSDADFDKGKAEAIAATKIVSDAFGNNKQFRLVGNHDPNAEGLTGYFTADQMNAFAGIYSNFLVKNDDMPYSGIGYCDFERQKVRLIVLNTSLYTPEQTPDQASTQYSFLTEQEYWLAQTLDLSGKEDVEEWQIVICSHIQLDYQTRTIIGRRSQVLNAYESGGTWSRGDSSYNFAGKNAAKLALYLNGHMHSYVIKNMRHLNNSGEVQNTLKMANIFVPNALPDRDYPGTDGVTYTKTANTAESTAFQVITIDFESKIAYAHHYGAGIDIVMHYDPSTAASFSTDLTSPTWASVDTDIATVSDGTVTPVANGNVMIYAKSETDNCIECWNYQAVT